MVHSRSSRRRLRVSVRVGQSIAREVGQPDQARAMPPPMSASARLLFWIVALSSSGPLSMSGGAASARWRAIWPRRLAPANRNATSDRIDFFGVATILRSLILFNLLFAVQTILDVVYLWGNAHAARRYQLCVLCASRRLSPHRHGVAGGGIRSRRNEARRPGRTVKGDPAAGLSLGRAERPAGRLIDPAPRSLCADLLCSPVGASRPLSGWASSPFGLLLIVARIVPESLERLADPREPHHPDGNALHSVR